MSRILEVEKEDMVPFKELIDDGVDGIMMGHVIVDAIDSKYPATLSKTLVEGYVREKLGFEGIIMTDWEINHGQMFGKSKYPLVYADLVCARGNDLYMPGSKTVTVTVKVR